MGKLTKRLTALGVIIAGIWIGFTGRDITPPGPWYVGLLIAVVAGLIGAALLMWGLS